jgi:hypothetical protein
MDALHESPPDHPASPRRPSSWSFGDVAGPGWAEPGAGRSSAAAPEADLGIWSNDELVAIVRRRGGRTVEVLCVAGIG